MSVQRQLQQNHINSDSKALSKDRDQNHHKEAQVILQQEKEQKLKLPVHKGLEKYKLLDKMGEFVFCSFHDDFCSFLLIKWRVFECL